MSEAAVTEERLRLVEAFLQEAVYRSRGAQAGAGLFTAGDPAAADCGLGAQAAVVLDLSAKGEELYGRLWPDGMQPDGLSALREHMSEWVRRQDALDRKRNHFLKDFRNTHGFDRPRYTAEQEAQYRAGLDAVNAEVEEERREVARSVAELG